MVKGNAGMFAARTLAVAAACLALASTGCAKQSGSGSPAAASSSHRASVVGSYSSIGYFDAMSNGRHKVVTRLWLENDGGWMLNAPTINSDGTTTPYYMRGTYAVSGDKLRLSDTEGPWVTGVIRGLKLVFKDPELTFVKDSPARALSSPSPSASGTGRSVTNASPSIGSGWVKVLSSGGHVRAIGWTYGPAFHIDGGTVRAVGTVTSDSPEEGVGYGIGFVRGLKVPVNETPTIDLVPTGAPAAPVGVLPFDAVTNSALKSGNYRFAITNSTDASERYNVTLYVKR